MFDKILIANRGEIACRIIKTARRLGIHTVAVYSDADAGARHVRLADEALPIGAAPARDSYLNAARLIETALAAGTNAVHPGYGFLAENADFAEACERAGLVFIGPPASAIRAMGSKSAAKALLENAGVPLVPGYHGDSQDADYLEEQAARIGYPVLIKASAGGGGKGMRIVTAPAEFRAALASCRREAASSFGDDRVLLEKYITRPRHIEVQVFADRHGNCVHLYERDCSVQRRYQKVVEEAPAPGMTAARRAAMGDAAIAAARAVGYVGAGTVEFIVAPDGAFYFMEMNTRLQVEHPVTEMITGLDLVEWQLRVAAGEALPLGQEGIQMRGHAIEARVYAENPERDFLPSPGRLLHLALPEESARVRVDGGVDEGDAITPHYDPMIAKLIVWGETREQARQRMLRALAACRIVGVASNVEFLARLMRCDAFAGADLDTGLIERERDALLAPAEAPPREVYFLAALAELLRDQEAARARAAASGDPHSPWHAVDAWRLNAPGVRSLVYRWGEREIELLASAVGDGYRLHFEGSAVTVSGRLERRGAVRMTIDGRTVAGAAVAIDQARHVFLDGRSWVLQYIDRLHHDAETELHERGLRAPMPGKITALLVAPGAKVERGAPLLVLEAMKMEHTIIAPGRGTVRAVNVKVGDQVSEGAELVDIALED